MQASDQGARTQVPRRTRVKGKPCIYRNTTEDGRTRYQFTYVDSSGKRRWQTIDGGLRQAEAARDEMRVRLRRGERVADSRLQLSDLVEEWLAIQTHLRPSTQEGYRRALNTQILPRLGRVRVSQINEDDIIRLVREMEAAGYAAWTIHGTLTPLRRALKYGCRRGFITSNPFDRLERGERPRLSTTKELRVLNRDEIEALLQAASPRYRVALSTAIFTGLRRGELLGLRWCDVDLQAGSVTVRYQLDRRSHKLVEPKTANARRTVALPRFLTQLLAEHRLASPYSQDTDYVFSTSQGTPMDARNFVRRSLTSALKRARLVAPGQTGIRFHDLRHTYASIMIAQGENVVYVSRQLGHSTPAITLGIYAHLIDQAEHARRATDRLDQGYAHVLNPANRD